MFRPRPPIGMKRSPTARPTRIACTASLLPASNGLGLRAHPIISAHQTPPVRRRSFFYPPEMPAPDPGPLRPHLAAWARTLGHGSRFTPQTGPIDLKPEPARAPAQDG